MLSIPNCIQSPNCSAHDKQLQQPVAMFSSLPEVLTAQQIAEVLSVCEKHVRELARQGKLVGFRVGRCHRFTRQSLIDFIQAGGTEI